MGIAEIRGASATVARREEENRHNPLPSIDLCDRKADRRLRFRRRLRRLHVLRARFGLEWYRQAGLGSERLDRQAGFGIGRIEIIRRLDLQARLRLRRLDFQARLRLRRRDVQARLGSDRKACLRLAAGDDGPKPGAGKRRLDEKPSPVQDSLGVLFPSVRIVCLRLVYHGGLRVDREKAMGPHYGLWMSRRYRYIS
jgi:hypothetical protein